MSERPRAPLPERPTGPTATGKARPGLARALGLVALMLLVPGVALWLLWPRSAAPELEPSSHARSAPKHPVLLSAVSQPARADKPDTRHDEIPLMQAGSRDSSEHGPRRPHPIDATRRRIYGENNLIAAMNQAMDLGNYQKLRELNAKYRQDYPEDENVLQDAYDMIADCQEGLSDERQARARAFWLKRRSSQLRRHLRRHCRL